MFTASGPMVRDSAARAVLRPDSATTDPAKPSLSALRLAIIPTSPPRTVVRNRTATTAGPSDGVAIRFEREHHCPVFCHGLISWNGRRERAISPARPHRLLDAIRYRTVPDPGARWKTMAGDTLTSALTVPPDLEPAFTHSFYLPVYMM